MIRKTTTKITGVMFSLLILPSVSNLVFAQYIVTDRQTRLDDYLQLAKDKVILANDNPKTGSGIPIFEVNGVVGALILSIGIFGGITATFFIRCRQGKYAAIGGG